MTELKHSATLSIASKVSSSWSNSVGAVIGGTDRIKKKISSLKTEQRSVTKAIRETESAAKKLGVDGSADIAKLRGRFDEISRSLDRNKHKLDTVRETISGVERASGAMKQLGSNVAAAGRAAAYAGSAAIAGIGWFTKSAIDATASMERLRAGISTLEGSDAMGREAMGWIEKFADTTPYKIEEVAEAYKKLRAYGINPTDGSLKTIGDTAAAMGKDMMSGAEAVADAMTGENERLKEFGIRASVAGDKITYFYKTASGKDAKKVVEKNGEMIKSTLMAIWNEKYSGAMEKQSRTWDGMMNRLSNKWTMFKVSVMEGGVFDLLKGELEGLLASVNKWSADGSLRRWAREISDAYKWAFGEIREGFTWVRSNWPEIKQSFQQGYEVSKALASTLFKVGTWARDAAGGADNLAKGLLVLGAAKTLAPLGTLVSTGWSVVAWLSQAVGLTGALSSGLSRAGGALKNTAVSAPSILGGLRGVAVGTASAGTVAGVVGAGAALGVGTGMLINAGVEAATGKSASDHLAEWMSSDVDEQRKRLAGGVTNRRGMVTNNKVDNRVINLNVNASGANADEVAEKVSRKLGQEMRRESMAGY